jgi:hypothetical protein
MKMVRPYGGSNRRLPDLGELLGIVMLTIIGVWGVWFGWQSIVGLWWPLNVAYAAAGGAVALISGGVAWALLNR